MAASDSKKGTAPRARDGIERRLQTLLAAAATSVTIAGCGSGYGVVDPMPSPARRSGLAAMIDAVATWKVVNGTLVIGVTLRRPAGRTDVRFDGANPAFVASGKVQAVQGGDTLTFEVIPDPGEGRVIVVSRVHTQVGTVTLATSLTLPAGAGTPVAGAPVQVTLTEE